MERRTTARPTDWRRRCHDAKPAKRVVLEAPFAGIPAGATLFVATPALIARYVGNIPAGAVRELPRLRDDLARSNDADATCPVSTSIFLRVVAEAAWDELQGGIPLGEVTPFWRAVAPDSALAKKLRCGADWIRAMRASEQTAR